MQIKIKKFLVLAILLWSLQLFEAGNSDSNSSRTKWSEEGVGGGGQVVQVQERQEADDGKQQGEDRQVGRDE